MLPCCSVPRRAGTLCRAGCSAPRVQAAAAAFTISAMVPVISTALLASCCSRCCQGAEMWLPTGLRTQQQPSSSAGECLVSISCLLKLGCRAHCFLRKCNGPGPSCSHHLLLAWLPLCCAAAMAPSCPVRSSWGCSQAHHWTPRCAAAANEVAQLCLLVCRTATVSESSAGTHGNHRRLHCYCMLTPIELMDCTLLMVLASTLN